MTPLKRAAAAMEAARARAAEVPIIEAVAAPAEQPKTSDIQEYTIEELFADAAVPSVAIARQPPQAAAPFGLLRPDQLDQLPQREWLVDGFIGRGEVGLLVGPSQAGKTFGVVDLGVAASHGKEWAGFGIAKPFGMIYLAGEGVQGLRLRLDAAHAHHGVSTANPRILIGQRIVDMHDPTAEDSIDKFLGEVKGKLPANLDLGLVVIDTLRAATPSADENSSRDMNAVVRNAYKIARELECAVLILHHTGKDGSAYRGSSAILADADFLYALSPSDGTTQMRVHKRRDGAKWEPRHFQVVEHGESAIVRWLEADAVSGATGTKEPTCEERVLFTLTADGTKSWTVPLLADELGAPRETVRSALKELCDSGRAESKKLSAKVVEYRLAEAACAPA